MGRYRNIILAGLALSVVVAVSAAYIASGEPDGLERVAEDQGFDGAAQDPGYEILPDYTVPGIEDEGLSTALAGIIGVAAAAALGLGAGWLLRNRRRANGASAPDSTE